MPPDILTQQQNVAVPRTERRCVGGSGGLAEILMPSHLRQRPMDRSRLGLGNGFQRSERRQRGRHGFDPAYAAAAFRNAGPRALHEPGQAFRGEIGTGHPSAPRPVELDLPDLAALRQPFRQGEAGHEIFEIGRRGHHHRIADPVEFDRDRDFHRNGAGRFADMAAREVQHAQSVDFRSLAKRSAFLQRSQHVLAVEIDRRLPEEFHYPRSAGFDPRSDRAMAFAQMDFEIRRQPGRPEAEKPMVRQHCRTGCAQQVRQPLRDRMGIDRGA